MDNALNFPPLFRWPRGLQSGLDSAKASLAAFGEVVFPNPDDAPPAFPQRPIHLAVPELVGGEFPFPEGPIAGRGAGMFGAGVPETAVHEHHHPRLAKDEIRFAEDFLIPPPAGDGAFSLSATHCQNRITRPRDTHSSVRGKKGCYFWCCGATKNGALGNATPGASFCARPNASE